MTGEISEAKLEEAIEASLVQEPGSGGVAEPRLAYGSGISGGYQQRGSADYDRSLCLLPDDVIDFVIPPSRRSGQRLAEHHGDEARQRFLRRLAREIERRGALDVLRRGSQGLGLQFQLAYFRPALGPQRRAAAALPGEPLHRGPAAPLQRAEPETASTWCSS